MQIVSNEVSSQICKHQEFGGVVPEVASRLHVENIYRVVDYAMKDISWDDIVAIAVTQGPGLLGSLMIGITQAKMLAMLKKKQLIGVNHMEGHIWANFLVHKKEYPFLTLVVSGGHTEIVLVKGYGDLEVLAHTLDDAAGEAFDKVARVLELGYPGGPIIDKISNDGDKDAIAFPRANIKDGSDNFSFSGIKTAVINYFRKNPDTNKKDIAASFQWAVVDTLVEKSIKLAKKHNISNIFLSGGVSANSHLRSEIKRRALEEGLNVFYPPLTLCTDNAAMIGAAAWERFNLNKYSELNIKASPSLRY